MAFDLLVTNARIVDGTGKKAYDGSVGVKDGRIAAVGSVSGDAKRVIDANGQVIAPGFIDAHTHYDAQLVWDPSIDPATKHGITTILMGNCGFTLAPVRPKDRDFLMGVFSTTEDVPKDVLIKNIPISWETFPEYMSFVERSPLGVNVVTQVGHTALRRYVMGESGSEREATPEEVEAMVRLAEEAMDAGAAGVSSSFTPAHIDETGEHVPSFFAAKSETLKLAEAVGRKGKRLVSINPFSKRDGLSDEDRTFLADLGKVSGAVVSWNDFSQSAPNWEKTLTFMEGEQARGNKIYAVASSQPRESRFSLSKISSLVSGYKVWIDFCKLEESEQMKALADPAWRGPLAEFWIKYVRYFNNMIVEKVSNPALKHLEGRGLPEIAEERGVGVVDAMFDVALEDNVRTFFMMRNKSADETNAERILKSPACLVGISDGGAHLQTFSGADYPTYFLQHWVKDKQSFTLEEAVAALSSEVADFVGLTDRGTLEVGKAADMVIFDPDEVGPGLLETLDFPGGSIRLAKRALGVPHVIVNGVSIIENGEPTGAAPGRLLRA